MTNFIELAGQRFGRLLVIERVQNDKSERAVWKCVCDCGNNTVATGKSLRNGNKISCGCYNRERSSLAHFENLVDEKFGCLLVLERVDDYIRPSGKTKNAQYLCQCDCGNTVIIVGQSLKNGSTVSCGCLKESFIASELKKYFVENYVATLEYKVLKNPDTGYWLPYDIHLSDENIFIEVHGRQHYMFIEYFHKTNEVFEYQKHKDKLKKKFAKENGRYIEINLTKIKTLEVAINYVENLL